VSGGFVEGDASRVFPLPSCKSPSMTGAMPPPPQRRGAPILGDGQAGGALGCECDALRRLIDGTGQVPVLPSPRRSLGYRLKVRTESPAVRCLCSLLSSRGWFFLCANKRPATDICRSLCFRMCWWVGMGGAWGRRLPAPHPRAPHHRDAGAPPPSGPRRRASRGRRPCRPRPAAPGPAGGTGGRGGGSGGSSCRSQILNRSCTDPNNFLI